MGELKELLSERQALDEKIAKARRAAGPAFKTGDDVAWHHSIATQHARESVIREDVIPEADAGAAEGEQGWRGKIVKADNSEGTQFLVDFGKKRGKKVLTADELVRVAPE